MDQKIIFDRRSAVAARGLLKSNLANFGLQGSPGALRRPKPVKNYEKPSENGRKWSENDRKWLENGRKWSKIVENCRKPSKIVENY